MPVVAGVDFGTQSVRVAIVDSERGVLGAGVGEYPVHRDRNDPDFATQSHEAHMSALAIAMRTALSDAGGSHRRATCIIAIAKTVDNVPGVCGVVDGSVHPEFAGIEAGLSGVGNVFDSIATRAGRSVGDLSLEVERYRAGQTGLLRVAWDNGDRTVLVNADLGGVAFGWNLNHTAADELFAAIEGTAFHTRIVLERMAEHGVKIDCVIHAGASHRRTTFSTASTPTCSPSRCSCPTVRRLA